MTLLIDSIIMIIDASFPLGIVMSPRTFYHLYSTDFGETEPQKDCFQTLAPEVTQELSSFLVLASRSPTETRKAKASLTRWSWPWARFEP